MRKKEGKKKEEKRRKTKEKGRGGWESEREQKRWKERREGEDVEDGERQGILTGRRNDRTLNTYITQLMACCYGKTRFYVMLILFFAFS